MAKIPSWDETTEIPSWDETKPIAEKPATPKPNPRDQVTFLGSENLGKIMADVFPRVARGEVEGKGAGKQAVAGLLDAVSLPGRGIAASGVAPKGASWKDGNPELGRIEGENFAGKALRDPGTGAALLTAPFTAGLSVVPELTALAKAANYGRVAAQGAIGGAASAAAHQAENALEGRGFRPGEAVGEVALNTLLPAAGRAGGKVLKAGGKKILNTILKPSKGVQEQIAKLPGVKTVADLIFKHDLDSPIPFTGGVEGIEARNDALRAKMNEQFGKILDDADRVVTLTTKAPPAQAAAGRTGIYTSGGVEDAPIYMAPEAAPRLTGPGLLPESTVPGPDDVVRSGMNRPPLLTDGRPAVMVTPAPRPSANPPGVVVTPNQTPIANQIDPRFIQPRGGMTANQPPIPDAPPGTDYGIPSNRNLPVPRTDAPLPARQEIPLSGADPLTADEARILGLPPGAAPGPSGAEFAGTAPSGQARLGAPAGGTETTIDLTNQINMKKAIDDAFGGLQSEFYDQGTHAGVLPGIEQGRDYWLETLGRKTADGMTPVRFSQGFKQEAGDAGNFLATDPGDVKGKARMANAVYRQIRDAQNEIMPDLIPINKVLSETYPVRDALADAIPRLEKNNIISPTDLWTLGPAAMGGSAGLYAGNPAAGAAAFAAPLLLNRLSKNPTVASQLYRFGESMVDPGAFGTLRKRAIERALATARDDANQ